MNNQNIDCTQYCCGVPQAGGMNMNQQKNDQKQNQNNNQKQNKQTTEQSKK